MSTVLENINFDSKEASMKLLSLGELKEAQLDILRRVLIVLDENDVKCFMYYGSLLGAIRHDGYIPWDDDIDLGLMRTEYNKIQNIDWQKYNLSLLSPRTSRECPYPHSKIVDNDSYVEEEIDAHGRVKGINIDLFPIDQVPQSSIKRFIKIRTIRLLQLFLSIKIVRIRADHSKLKKTVMCFSKAIFLPFKEGFFARMIDKVAQKLNRQSASAGCLMGSYHERDITNSEYFESFEIKRFEGIEVAVPKRYDEVLSSLYGNYMALPPVEKQVTHHFAKAFRIKR